MLFSKVQSKVRYSLVLLFVFFSFSDIQAQDEVSMPNFEPIEIQPIPTEKGCGELSGIDCINSFFRDHIVNNFKYPKKAKRKGITGKAYVEFIINKKGDITKATIVRSSGNDMLDTAAKELIMSIPSLYKPAFQKGKAVNVKYTIPIGFKLT